MKINLLFLAVFRLLALYTSSEELTSAHFTSLHGEVATTLYSEGLLNADDLVKNYTAGLPK
jgi:hypothetical protein